SGSRWVAATASGSGWTVPCGASPCRVRYRFALRPAATTLHDVDTAVASGDVVAAPPSTWLLRPAGNPVQGRFRFHVSCEPPTRFTAGTHPSRDGAADTFEASTSALDQSSFAVFGRFDEEDIRSDGSRVVVAIAPQGLALSEAEVTLWVRRAVSAITAYLGRFPAERSLVVVEGGIRGPTRGETLGEGGPAVLVRVGEGVDAAKTRDDWVMTHELLHVSLPTLPREQAWLNEGIPTYVEPVVRVRDGQITAERFWTDLVEGLPQGLPEAGDEGLDRTHTWGRTYWGGALFCFVADITMREQTQNARALDDALRAIAATGANAEQDWTIDRFLDAGDRATGTRVLRDLYDRMARAPETVDLPAIWSRLGVRRTSDHRVTFDDRAPLAAIRRSITEPLRPPAIPGPGTFFETGALGRRNVGANERMP
ncbi:MAG TPA: hypothetical protein VN894_19515, partial [Polyangiaceae bacterium]|nr:hypothetical protein [Polyangiaceae bacterium]